jgi:hypothetical protein
LEKLEATLTKKPEALGLPAVNYAAHFSYLTEYEDGGYIYPASMARDIGSTSKDVLDFLFVIAANSHLSMWSLPKVDDRVFEKKGFPDLTTDPLKFKLDLHPETMDPIDPEEIEILCAFRFA